MTEKKKSDEWIEAAERFGNELAQHLERFGDKLQKTFENVESSVRGPSIEVEDQRTNETGTPVSNLRRGEVFDFQRGLYMRIGEVPEAPEPEGIHAVNLASGDVKTFDKESRVEPVDAKVVVRDKGASA